MGSLMDKINERNAQAQKKSNGYIKNATTRMKWKDGKNQIRFVGNYVEVHTHSISPSSFGSIGVADGSLFKGKGCLPFEVTCTDWNLQEEKMNKDRTCPFCKLYHRSCEVLKRKDLQEDERKTFEQIKAATKPVKKLKWNVIDRAAPFYLKVNNGVDEEVRGFKVADFSFSMFEDVKGIIEQNAIDVTDPDAGIDIAVIKGQQDGRVKYSIQPCLERMSVKLTPLTDEEKSWKMWDFVDMYNKPYDFNAIKPKMHDTFRIILDMSDEEFKETIESTSPPHEESEDAESKKN